MSGSATESEASIPHGGQCDEERAYRSRGVGASFECHGLGQDRNDQGAGVAHIGHTVEMTGDTMDMSGSLMITAADLKMVSK